MKTISPIIVIAFVLGGCAVNSGVVATSADTFSVSRQAATGFTGLAGLYPEAVKEASEQCSKMGKQYVELNRSSSRPPYIAGNFPRVEIQFRCGQVGPSNAEKCFSDIANDPSLAGIKDKVALARVDDQTFTMLTDKSTPTTRAIAPKCHAL